MRMATRLHTKPCGYVSHVERWHQSPAPSWGLIILAQFAMPWDVRTGHYAVFFQFKMSIVPSEMDIVKHQLHAIYGDLSLFCFG